MAFRFSTPPLSYDQPLPMYLLSHCESMHGHCRFTQFFISNKHSLFCLQELPVLFFLFLPSHHPLIYITLVSQLAVYQHVLSILAPFDLPLTYSPSSPPVTHLQSVSLLPFIILLFSLFLFLPCISIPFSRILCGLFI